MRYSTIVLINAKKKLSSGQEDLIPFSNNPMFVDVPSGCEFRSAPQKPEIVIRTTRAQVQFKVFRFSHEHLHIALALIAPTRIALAYIDMAISVVSTLKCRPPVLQHQSYATTVDVPRTPAGYQYKSALPSCLRARRTPCAGRIELTVQRCGRTRQNYRCDAEGKLNNWRRRSYNKVSDLENARISFIGNQKRQNMRQNTPLAPEQRARQIVSQSRPAHSESDHVRRRYYLDQFGESLACFQMLTESSTRDTIHVKEAKVEILLWTCLAHQFKLLRFLRTAR
eukprot:334260_1